ncbi:MAG TPA: ribonuclease HII [Microcella sp.]|nr:ribonuclease HII [Microcella sp.]
MPVDATLEVERALFAAGAPVIIGIDEVGRGALAGVVAVGACAILPTCGEHPSGLRDSKLLSPARRAALVPLAQGWAQAIAVGESQPSEVDELGIIAALGLAGRRALIALHDVGVDVGRAEVIVDGVHDWLTPALVTAPRIRTRAKADRDCASVAAASIIAKEHRDALMRTEHERLPVYGWDGNKGYGSPAHLAAIAEHGPSDRHRRSWLRSPGATGDARGSLGAEV